LDAQWYLLRLTEEKFKAQKDENYRILYFVSRG
jgi:hypothetical protein